MQVGCSEIVGRVVEDLKDESEPYRQARTVFRLLWFECLGGG